MNTTPTSSIKSPCILICSIDMASGYCFGCGRTSNEIGNWVNYTDQQRDDIMAQLKTRMDTLPKRRERRTTKRNRLKQK